MAQPGRISERVREIVYLDLVKGGGGFERAKIHAVTRTSLALATKMRPRRHLA